MKKITVRPQSPRPDKSPLSRIISEERRVDLMTRTGQYEFFQPIDLSTRSQRRVAQAPAAEQTTTADNEAKKHKFSCAIL
jgi:hypothetical protein